MIEEMYDTDTFHQDFTNATAWEGFIEELEKVINKWKLTQPSTRPILKQGALKGDWETKSEDIRFEDDVFNFSFWSLKENDEYCNSEEQTLCSNGLPQAFTDMMTEIMADDFIKVPSCPLISQMYGIREFTLLKPGPNVTVATETKAKLLLSSVTMAVNNSGCEVPVFVQFREPWQNMFIGSCASRNVSADYEIVHLERTPQHCKHLTGLLEVFKGKISKSRNVPPISVSACLTYKLQPVKPWDNQEILLKRISDGNSSCLLPFGFVTDPISELYLLATWCQLTDQVVVDTPSYSDLEPLQAQFWHVRIHLPEIQVLPRLAQCLDALCNFSALPLNPVVSKDSKLSHSLDVLTDSRVPTISKVLSHVKERAGSIGSLGADRRRQGSMADNQVSSWLSYYLFPDVNDTSVYPYDFSSGDAGADQLHVDVMKTVKPDTLVWRLAVAFSLMMSSEGPTAAGHVWCEFVEEMRSRWERGVHVPGILPGFADQKTCILNQKLQMLNVCIDYKRSRESQNKPNSDSDDEEFFDCDTLGDAETEQDAPIPRLSLWNQPDGRQSKHPNLRLLNTGEPLYIPVVQKLVPDTEDEPKKHELSHAKAFMMSATLSDMESFKAANPNGVIEDFIRWYSPRDWVEDPSGELDQWGQPVGQLSARMQLPDNAWLDLWKVAKPVPARRQRRLFDETRSAELVLGWLEGMSARDVALALLPPLSHACAMRLFEAGCSFGKEIPGLSALVDNLAVRVAAASREPILSVKSFQKLVADVTEAENLISQIASLRSNFSPAAGETLHNEGELKDFLSNLLANKEAQVPGGAQGPIGTRIAEMLFQAHKLAQTQSGAPGEQQSQAPPVSSKFPSPHTKEMVMRVYAPRPSTSSRPVPQRLYALLRKDEFKLAGCFTRDAVFC